MFIKFVFDIGFSKVSNCSKVFSHDSVVKMQVPEHPYDGGTNEFLLSCFIKIMNMIYNQCDHLAIFKDLQT